MTLKSIVQSPVGVFLLMIYTVGSIGLGNLIGPISKYIGLVLTGLLDAEEALIGELRSLLDSYRPKHMLKIVHLNCMRTSRQEHIGGIRDGRLDLPLVNQQRSVNP